MEATKFGDSATGDFLASKGEVMRGVGGYHDALNLRDNGSGVKMCYPTKGRDTDDCLMALKKFGGDTTRIRRFYSDKEGGLVAACKQMNILHRVSQPGKPVTNSLAERANQDILQHSRALLNAAGLPECFWPFAAPYYCLMESLTYDKHGERIYKNWSGDDFNASIIPFGALVTYKVPDTRKGDMQGKWGNTGQAGVFAGYELSENGKWNNLYLVWNLCDFENMNFASDVYAGNIKLGQPNRVAACKVATDEYEFPCRAPYLKKNRTVEGALEKEADPSGLYTADLQKAEQ